MKLAVTADDFGIDPAVNAGIVALAQAGRITSSSVMLHRDATLDGLDDLGKSGIAIGLHLVFVEERPLGDGPAIASLLDGGGRFPPNYKALFASISVSPRRVAALRDEAAAQLERFRSLGWPLRFINSHQHVHLFPTIWQALAPLFEEHPTAAVRVATGPRLSLAPQALLSASGTVATGLRRIDNARLSPIGIDLAGHLNETGLDALLAATTKEPPPQGLAELVVHPGRESRGLHNRYGHWRYAWQREYDLLSSPRFPSLLAEHGVELEIPA